MDRCTVTPSGRTLVSVPVLLPEGPYATLKPAATGTPKP